MNRKQPPAPTSKRQAIKEQRARRQRQQRLTTILLIAGAALIVAALLIYPTIKNNLTPVGDITKITPVARPQANLNAMGDPNAPVKIVEYSDFQCPYCKRFNDDTEQQLVDTYVATGKVHYTYIPFGPAGQWIGPESEAAAKAAYCAGDQGKFWEYKEYLFANQTGENIGDFTDKRLTAFAEALSLNMADFNSCFKSSKYNDTLQEGLTKGVQLGIQGTPSFTINGKIVTGALPFADFQKEIEAALSAAASK